MSNAYREPILLKIKKSVQGSMKKSFVGKLIYPAAQKLWQMYSVPARRRRLHKYGYDVLSKMHQLLTANGVKYYCDAGTLLGFIRDGGFIKHDDDIDICIMPNTMPLSKVLKLFIDAGYGYIHAFDYNGEMIEFSVMDPSHVSIDVFLFKPCSDDPNFYEEIFLFWYPDRVYPSETANTALQYRFVGPRGLVKHVVNSVEVVIPVNAEEMLDSEYGPWRTPDPNYKFDQIKHTELPGYAYRLTKEVALSHE